MRASAAKRFDVALLATVPEGAKVLACVPFLKAGLAVAGRAGARLPKALEPYMELWRMLEPPTLPLPCAEETLDDILPSLGRGEPRRMW